MDASATSSSPLKNAANKSVVTIASALPFGESLKEYVITGIIGEGGFGIVYSAHDTLLKRNVAIKEYMPAAIATRLESAHINLRSPRHQQAFDAGMQGFIDEARLLAQFKHPALVEILRFWEAKGTAYMVMPHYSGKTLRNLLRQNRKIATENWLKQALDPVLDATELLHNHNIYHRDIAPDNIVIQDSGKPVLLDLGSARRVIAGMQSALTVVVKPGYAPIEQYTEDTVNEQGPWTDIYALGAVLYFSITGNAPTASVSRMMRDTLKPLDQQDHPQYSKEFLTAINCALKLRPSDRFQTIAEFRDALNINVVQAESSYFSSQINEKENSIGETSDEEITQILTEEEIGIFKDKLLNTLSSVKPKTQTDPLKETFFENTGFKGKVTLLDENILGNKYNVINDSISSFDDVKNLLESNTRNSIKIKQTKNHEPAKPSQAYLLNKNPEQPKDQTNNPNIALAIGGAALVTILLSGVYLITQNSQDESLPLQLSNEKIAISAAASREIENSEIHPGIVLPTENITEKSIEFINPEPTQRANEQLQSSALTINSATELTGSYTSESIDSAQIHDSIENKKDDEGSTKEINTPPISPIENETKTELPIESIKNKHTQKSDTKSTVETNSTNIFGTAKITLLPWGEIWVENQRYGVSPPIRELSLAPGTYHIELRNPGLPIEFKTININQGDNPAIFHNFSAPQHTSVTTQEKNNAAQKTSQVRTTEPTKGTLKDTQAKTTGTGVEQKPPITKERTLNIKVTPWGEVFIDGKIAGLIPPLRKINISPGEHTLEIRHPNYETKIISISATDTLAETIEHHFK